MSKQRSLAVWVLEMLCQAVGTALWMMALALIQAAPGSRNDVSLNMILGTSSVVLMEFALTGYLVTTALSALYLPRPSRFLYPLVSGGLYLIHSGIFFVAIGNHILDPQNLAIQIGGGWIAVTLTLVGDQVRGLPHLLVEDPPHFGNCQCGTAN